MSTMLRSTFVRRPTLGATPTRRVEGDGLSPDQQRAISESISRIGKSVADTIAGAGSSGRSAPPPPPPQRSNTVLLLAVVAVVYLVTRRKG
jgi:hypothetical protein